MKHLSWIVCCAALWLGLMPPLASAQEHEAEVREQPVQDVFQTGLVYPQERGADKSGAIFKLVYEFSSRRGEGAH